MVPMTIRFRSGQCNFLTAAMKKEGNYFEQHTCKGMRHYLGEGNPKYSRYYNDDILKLADDFLRKFNFLD